MSERQYRRLTRLRRSGGRFFSGFGTFSGLWLGADHLLSITSNRFAEDYKRFYFRDIQSLTVLQTSRRRIWNFVFAFLTLLFLALIASSAPTPLEWLWLLVPVSCLVFNNILGPTCTVFLRTEVHVEELPSLRRVYRAHKIIARIRPLIAEAQGELSEEETLLRVRELFPDQRTSFATGPLNLFR